MSSTETDSNKHAVYAALDDLKIEYTIHEHPPVYTVEQARAHWADIPGAHPKNLFLRNDKGNRHFLVIVDHKRQVDLKTLASQLRTGRLSFASERRLLKHLRLTPGSVSGFGILNDRENAVEVIIDRALMDAERINFHPNDNTATVTLGTEHFRRFLEYCGNTVRYINLD